MEIEDCSFPLFVSPAALQRETDHIESFAPEVAWITKSGESDLEIPIAIHPTSETVMYPYFPKWIRGHRDLPMKLNQWNNVVRWELSNPTLFIRFNVFLSQDFPLPCIHQGLLLLLVKKGLLMVSKSPLSLQKGI
ncbi:hypothetical protein AgCh_013048 [Apium graveolens]